MWGADGFFLDRNEWDAIYLDDIIFRDLTTPQKEELREQQYDGYVPPSKVVAACSLFLRPVAGSPIRVSQSRDLRIYEPA
jgi:hypothetical protein